MAAIPQPEPPPLDGEILGKVRMGGRELWLIWQTRGRHPARLWAYQRDLHGQWWPAQNGLHVNVPELGRFADAVAAALDRAEQWVARQGSKAR